MNRQSQILQRSIGAIVLAVIGAGLSAPVFVAIVAGVIILLVAFDISWRLRNPVTEPA